MSAQISTLVDPRTIQRLLDGEYAAIRERVRTGLAAAGLERDPEPPPTPEYRQKVLEWARALAEEGGTGLGFPREFGGEDDVGGSIAAFETLALGDLSLLVKAGVQWGLFGGAVLHLGTRKHHERYLARIISLELPGCFAMTETGHGSNVQAVRTTATYDPRAEEFVIDTPDPSATKDYIGNAALHGRMAAVFAQLYAGDSKESRGVHCLLVPIRDEKGRPCPGVELSDCGHKLGLNGVDNGRISFDGVRVPRDALLDRYAEVRADGTYFSSIENPNRRFFTMLGTLIQGRISVCGAAISATKVAQTIAVRHANRRRQFGPPGSDSEALLLDYRAHQRRLLPDLARTFAYHFAQQELIAELDRAFTVSDYPEHDRRELEARAAGLKALATWHAVGAIQTCREACGGAGYMAENRFAELRADTDVFTTFEGDNTILLQLVAKGLLTDYRDEFGELDTIGTVAFVAEQVYETVVERTAVREIVQRLTDELVPGREDEHDLLEREYQLGLLRWREEHMLSGVARRLKRGIDAGEDPFDVFNECQDHVIATARAHVEREVAEAFVRSVEGIEDKPLATLIGRLCDLYIVATLENERAWLQEHGRISSPRAKATTRTVNSLCAELRPQAEALVDAFGIPDALLAAPIGLKSPPDGAPA